MLSYVLHVQGEHYSQLLDNERRMVVSLRSSLQAKERELTEAMNKFLQEKVEATKAQGELAALRARLETAQQHITSLRNKVYMEPYMAQTLYMYMCVYIMSYRLVATYLMIIC